MPSSTTDAEIAVLAAVSVALGSSGAVLGRARRDVDAVKAGLQRARETMHAAFWGFVAVMVAAWLLVNWWINGKH